MPANPPRAARFPNRFMLFMLFIFPIEPSPGIPANGIIDESGFFGSNAPRPGKLDSKLALRPARPEKFAMLAAAAAAALAFALDDDCFLFEDEDDEDVEAPP